ncbi:MAG: hypothetical protein RLY49_305 [Candidatus Parcubacteria bacterium]|jgi:glycosyltransferase involved in cell wall biosynthesis
MFYKGRIVQHFQKNMRTKITIIIPCFNCAETVVEAIDSLYRQDIDDFEIIAVDDCSTDTTYQILLELSQKYPELYVYKNEKNLGGGATRNIAVSKAQNELIFCLDSDDMLGDGTLKKMILYWENKRCDGIGISTSIKFKGTNIHNISYISNFEYIDEVIPLKSLFEKDTCSLYSVFMFTKTAFEKIGGYPENHGFDTQGFAFKFLSNGLIAYTCPNTIYLHRIAFHDSYYIREAQSGKINLNWFKIFLESLYIFTDSTKLKILSFDLTSNKNIMSMVCEQKEIIDQNFQKLNISPEQYLLNTSKSLKIKESKIKKIIQIYASKKAPLSYKNVPKYIGLKFKKIIKKSKLKYFVYAIRTRIIQPNRIRKIVSLINLKIKKGLKIKFKFPIKNLSTEIDFIIPVTKKDLFNLPHTLKFARKNIAHKIKDVYIIAKKEEVFVNFCNEHDAIFIDEDIVIDRPLSDIKFRPFDINRDGWLFQQLLKIGMYKHVKCENYLVLDSDTVLLNKHSFKDGDKTILFNSEELHYPYQISYKNIFGRFPKHSLSFVSHMMLLNTKKIEELLKQISPDGKWVDTIIKNTVNDVSGFSEYETYGNWMIEHYPKEVSLFPLYNKSMNDISILKEENLLKNLKKKYNSISFHNY